MSTGLTGVKSALVKKASAEAETLNAATRPGQGDDSNEPPDTIKDALHRLDAGTSVQALAVGDGILYAGLQGGQIAVTPPTMCDCTSVLD